MLPRAQKIVNPALAVICVTAMLHNIAAKAGVALVEPEDIEDDDDVEDRCKCDRFVLRCVSF